MKQVTIIKATLLSTLKGNLSRHEEEFKQAAIDRRALLEQRWAEQAAVLASGGEPDCAKLMLPQPHSFAAEYKRAIAMLEVAQEESFVVTDDEFRQYMLDEWYWKQAFNAATAVYKK